MVYHDPGHMCGHLSMHGMELQTHPPSVPACSQTILSGHTLYHPLLEITTSVLLEVITGHVEKYNIIILCGMELVVLVATLVASSTSLHGSVGLYLQLPVMTLK